MGLEHIANGISTSDLVSLPVYGEDIPGFVKWVNWNGYRNGHEAFDFAAYMNDKGQCVLGLPAKTPVRAIADGMVTLFSRGEEHLYGAAIDSYLGRVHILHQLNDEFWFYIGYVHIVPDVKLFERVKKGEPIGTLYKDPEGDIGRLVHLHFTIYKYNDHIKLLHSGGEMDSKELFGEITDLIANPQGIPEFRILGLDPQPEIVFANFKLLQLYMKYWKNKK